MIDLVWIETTHNKGFKRDSINKMFDVSFIETNTNIV